MGCKEWDDAALNLLLEKGSELEIKDNECSRTPLSVFFACSEVEQVYFVYWLSESCI
jgi:hypothetical protein